MSAHPHDAAAPTQQQQHIPQQHHSHGGKAPKLQSSKSSRLTALITTLAIALITVIGLIFLWPHGNATANNIELGNIEYLHGQIISSENKCPAQYPKPCQTITVGIQDGPDAGQITDIYVQGALAKAGLQTDDVILLAAQKIQKAPTPTGAHTPDTQSTGSDSTAPIQTDDNTQPQETISHTGSQPAQAAENSLTYAYGPAGVERNTPLLILALLFIIAVALVGRLRGALALLALGISAAVILTFVLPALVRGEPALLVCLLGALAIMFPTLYFVHGINLRTTAALFGTVAGAVLITLLSLIAAWACRMSGIADETSSALATTLNTVDFRGLLTGAILISGLGILNDVTITQASAVWELRAASPTMERRELFQSAMRIGRDHIASSVYTIFFAYVGGAMATLLALFIYNRPILDTLTQEDITIEIVSTLTGAIGLVLSVPITTALAVWFAGSPLVQKQFAEN